MAVTNPLGTILHRTIGLLRSGHLRRRLDCNFQILFRRRRCKFWLVAGRERLEPVVLVALIDQHGGVHGARHVATRVLKRAILMTSNYQNVVRQNVEELEPSAATNVAAATLAAAFLGCSASAAWTLEARRGVRGAAEPADDPQAALVVRKGHEHEATCLAGLKERCGDFVEIPSGALKTRFAATVDAMERGVPLIYQAALTTGAWLGYADFLVRVEDGCPRWAWSYEPWDAKLARSARPEHVLQIALYGDLLGTVQGRAANHGSLMLGTGELETPYKVESFPLDEVRYYVRRAARRLEPGYSIKNLERFYMPARTTAVATGGDSLVIYDRFRETGENSLLNDLRDYNRDDCLSTFLLRDWLIERAKESGRWACSI
jgi:predicted RecB family nuclease